MSRDVFLCFILKFQDDYKCLSIFRKCDFYLSDNMPKNSWEKEKFSRLIHTYTIPDIPTYIFWDIKMSTDILDCFSNSKVLL